MSTTYFVGTSGWHYNDWQGIFYPPGLPKAGWLGYYARHFGTVEVNNTFYRMPGENAVTVWREASPPGFIFALKVSRFVTHMKRLVGTDAAMQTFLSRAALLGDKLGPLLYQTPPQMKRDDGRLEEFLSFLPRRLRHVFEFRHQSWFDDAVLALLRRYNAGFCIYDLPGLTSPVVVTADYAYVRFHGSRSLYSSLYSDDELTAWADKISALGKGVDTVYAYFNNDAQSHAVQNAGTLHGLLSGRVSYSR